MNEILPLTTTWMDLEGIILSKISQTEKDKYLMLPHMESKKKKTKKKKKQNRGRHRYRGQTGGSQGREGRGRGKVGAGD